jgi:ABC-type Zn2+ transport system substrate-binding protein/surface adhesin
MKRLTLLLAALVFLLISSAPNFGLAEEYSHEGEYRENQHEKHQHKKYHKKLHKKQRKHRKRHEEEHRESSTY